MNVTYIGNHSDEKPMYLVNATIYAKSGSSIDADILAENAGYACPFGTIIVKAGLTGIKMKDFDGSWVEVE